MCKCDCGNEKSVMEKLLRKGKTKSCGCYRNELIHRSRIKDLTGKKFNRLSVLEPIEIKRGFWVWKCKCDCEKITKVNGVSLTSNTTKSCGCYCSEVSRNHIRELMKSRGGFKGKNHPQWRFDISDDERKDRQEKRSLPDFKKRAWVKKIYRRDKFTCQKCKKSESGKLTAHHIYAWNSHPKLRYIKRNGITLCLTCHINFHKKYGYGDNTKKQFTEYMSVLQNNNATS